MLEDLEIPALDSITPQRRPFFEALIALREGDLETARKGFKRASRKVEPPFDHLALLGAGECDKLAGKEGSALRTWKKVAENADAPHPLRYSAWLNIASLEEARDNVTGVAEAKTALAALGEPDSTT